MAMLISRDDHRACAGPRSPANGAPRSRPVARAGLP